MKRKPQRATGWPPASPALAEQGDLFAPDPVRLPDIEDLGRMYNSLNDKHFEGKLPSARIKWSKRLRIAGNCRPDTGDIRMSVHYHTHFPEEIEYTLIHEMLHLIHPKHNAAFRRAAEKLGVSVHCREYPGLHPRSRYTYICPNCRGVYHRQKRADISCGKCSGRRYDPRYRLVLQKSSPQRRRVARGR